MYNILICDDEQDIVNALKIYLSGGDYCLFEASNGREALEVAHGQEREQRQGPGPEYRRGRLHHKAL